MRIIRVAAEGGAFGQGSVRSEIIVPPDGWSFDQRPEDERTMPTALGLETLWQLMGFFLAWRGASGLGRAIAVADFRISGLVGPGVRLVEYGVDLKKVKRARVTLGIADGWIKVDGFLVSTARTLKYGLFTQARDEPSIQFFTNAACP